jgi:hypothetical protein
MKDHTDKLEKGDIFRLPVDLAHPTQFAVGMVSVDCKRKQIERLHEGGGLDEFLCQEGHLAPVVIGPGGVFYLTDHHHLCSSLWRADIPAKKKSVVAYVLHDWSDKEPDAFWREMIDGSLTWLYDEKGTGPLNPRILPSSIGAILNDPYRTLSRWLRDCGCYTKDELKDKSKPMCAEEKFLPASHAKAFFIEFRWANFLRENVRLEQKGEDFSKTCAAMPYSSLYLSKEAKALEHAFDIVVELIGCHALREVTYDQDGCLVKK